MAAEWAVRIVVTYVADPAPDTDLSDPEDTRALVRAFVMPGILALRSATTTSHATAYVHQRQQGSCAMTTISDDERASMKSNLDIIGRDNINDLDAVLSFVGHYDVDGYHRVPDNCPAEFTWDYEKGAKPQLDKLYEKAKKAQWNGQTDLAWSIEVDQEKVVINNAEANQDTMRWGQSTSRGTVLEKWGDNEWLQFGVENQNWTALPVHARRAGRTAVHRQDRRDRAVDRRQVLRRHPGDGRGAPRGGILPVPRREALGPLPDERPPRAAAGRHR